MCRPPHAPREARHPRARVSVSVLPPHARHTRARARGWRAEIYPLRWRSRVIDPLSARRAAAPRRRRHGPGRGTACPRGARGAEPRVSESFPREDADARPWPQHCRPSRHSRSRTRVSESCPPPLPPRPPPSSPRTQPNVHPSVHSSKAAVRPSLTPIPTHSPPFTQVAPPALLRSIRVYPCLPPNPPRCFKAILPLPSPFLYAHAPRTAGDRPAPSSRSPFHGRPSCPLSLFAAPPQHPLFRDPFRMTQSFCHPVIEPPPPVCTCPLCLRQRLPVPHRPASLPAGCRSVSLLSSLLLPPIVPSYCTQPLHKHTPHPRAPRRIKNRLTDGGAVVLAAVLPARSAPHGPRDSGPPVSAPPPPTPPLDGRRSLAHPRRRALAEVS